MATRAIPSSWRRCPRSLRAWQSAGKLDTTYSHAGVPLAGYETPAMYGGTIGYFLLEHPTEAAQIYREKLAGSFDAATNSWKTPLSYYDDNWTWFGIGLYAIFCPTSPHRFRRAHINKYSLSFTPFFIGSSVGWQMPVEYESPRDPRTAFLAPESPRSLIVFNALAAVLYFVRARLPLPARQ
jgi:hypothetical protein